MNSTDARLANASIITKRAAGHTTRHGNIGAVAIELCRRHPGSADAVGARHRNLLDVVQAARAPLLPPRRLSVAGARPRGSALYDGAHKAEPRRYAALPGDAEHHGYSPP